MQSVIVIQFTDKLVTICGEELCHLLTLIGASRWFIYSLLLSGLSIFSVEIVQLWYMITNWTYYMEISRVLIDVL